MVEKFVRDSEKIINGPQREPPEDHNSVPEEGVIFETKEEFNKRKRISRNTILKEIKGLK